MSDAPQGWQEQVLSELASADPFELAESARVFATKAGSDEMGVYYLIVLPWIVVCTCAGFRYRSECRHARNLLDSMESDAI